MTEPVEGSATEQSVGEGVAPLGEVEVGGDDGGAAFVALGDEVVEVLVLRCPQGFQTEVIDDEQRHAGKGLESSLVGVDGARGMEARQQLALGGEQHVVVGAKSGVFHTVMERLGVRVMTHVPTGRDGRRPTTRSKGKVERPFRTVKETHETLYHFHKPETEAAANAWLARAISQYNAQPHRREPHSRIEDWIRNLPAEGLRQMCSWERFCAFAREPERRTVAGDARAAYPKDRFTGSRNCSSSTTRFRTSRGSPDFDKRADNSARRTIRRPAADGGKTGGGKMP